MLFRSTCEVQTEREVETVIKLTQDEMAFKRKEALKLLKQVEEGQVTRIETKRTWSCEPTELADEREG